VNKDIFRDRNRVIQTIILTVAAIFILRLFYLQVIEKKYVSLAKSNAIKEVDIYPTRGLVYDRKNELIVYNEAIYDLMVIPRQAKGVDTAKFCELLGMTKEDYIERFAEMHDSRGYSSYKPNVFIKQISQKDYSRFQEYLYLFPGFYGQVRTERRYPRHVGAAVLGDIGEVDDKQIDESDGYYKPGDYVGKSGIEKVYEKELGGTRGKKFIFVDVHNRDMGSFSNKEFDTASISGDNVITTLDIKLQEYGEKLMQNKKGSIVAIEPSTGEILALVSSPGFDPNLLCGAVRSQNYASLLTDSLLPLYSRPTLATYPPGSSFKPVVALIALTEGAQPVNYTVHCDGTYHFGSLSLHCSHHHPSCTNIQTALEESCNPYFWQTFRNTIENRKYDKVVDIYGKWVKYCQSFGLGLKTGVDLPSEVNGNIPSVNYYNRVYGEGQWKFSNIISLGIGQGEILVTPIQMANLYACLGNKGYYITPHVVKKITDPVTGKDVTRKNERHETLINKEYYDPVVEGLHMVVESGTAKAARVEGISLCGKTGTAQNPHGDNHSMFAGFAPMDNPKIAIAVIVENGGYGAAYAAPIASLMVEKYLNDTISTKRLPLEKRMMEGNLLNKYGVSVNKTAAMNKQGEE